MRKKKTTIIVASIVLVVVAVVFLILGSGLSLNIGACIAADNDRYLIIVDDSPVVMHSLSSNNDYFSKLQTGDRILIVNDGIAETLPGQTGVYFLLKIGSNSNISEEAIHILKELGWIKS